MEEITAMIWSKRLLAALFVPAALVLAWFALHAISPWRQPGPLSVLRVGARWEHAAAFDGRALRCVEQERGGAPGDSLRLRAICAREIAGKPLEVSVAYTGVNGTCAATYAGEPVPCSTAIPYYNAELPAVMVESDLGLDPASLRRLPGANPLFYLSEPAWLWMGSACAAVIAGLAMWLYGRAAPPAALNPRAAALRSGAYLLGGGALFALTWLTIIFAIARSGLVD